jgi:hypothetical protein
MVQDGDLIAIRRKELGMLDSEQLESMIGDKRTG